MTERFWPIFVRCYWNFTTENWDKEWEQMVSYSKSLTKCTWLPPRVMPAFTWLNSLSQWESLNKMVGSMSVQLGSPSKRAPFKESTWEIKAIECQSWPQCNTNCDLAAKHCLGWCRKYKCAESQQEPSSCCLHGTCLMEAWTTQAWQVDEAHRCWDWI